MIKTDTERIVRKAAVLDNRQVTDAVIDAWHDVIGHVDYLVAERALVKARQDPNIVYLEPKHVIAKARDAIVELNEEARVLAREAEDEGSADPEPICRPHNSRITQCDDCCHTLSERGKAFPRENLHEWAVANLYVRETEEPF